MRATIVLAAVLCWAIAAWCSRGALAVTGEAAGALRLGVLPGFAHLALLLVLAVVIGLTPRLRSVRIAPIFLSALAVLPWVPGAPAPLLIWTGPITNLVWTAIVAGLIVANDWPAFAPAARRIARAAADPTRAPWLASAGALVFFSSAAWLVSPSVPSGDEPHYLIITQSLLHDFDLQIENNHRQRDFDAYLTFADLKPDYLERGVNGEIYSVHAPGLPALVAPAFAAAGYQGVKVFLILVAALGSALVWTVGFRAGGTPGAAWFAWAATTFSTTTVFHSFTVYPDGPGGLLVLTGLWALIRLGPRRRQGVTPGQEEPAAAGPLSLSGLALHGAALALLPWLHSRFAVLAGVLGVFIAVRIVARDGWRHMWRPLAAFLAVPAVSALGWFAFFFVIYGSASPLAVYGDYYLRTESSWAYVTSGLGGLFFDQQFGLLPYSPVLVAGLVGLAPLARDRSHRVLALAIVVTAIPYLLSVTHFRMWWAGTSAPARFLVPLVPTLAIPAAVAWRRATSGATKATFSLALGFTAWATVSLALVRDGRMVYNVRDGLALWLEWLSPLAALPLGLPSFHRTPEGAAFVHVAIWVGCLLAAWLALRALERAGVRSREALAMAAPAVLAAAVMGALALVWRANGASGVTPTPAQLQLLRGARAPGVVGVQLHPLRRLDVATLLPRLAIDTWPRASSSRGRPLFVLPGVPAGAYLLRVETSPHPSGTLWMGIAPDEFRLQEWRLDAAGGGPVVTLEVRVPVDVRAIEVHGDEPARAEVSRITLVPTWLVDASRLPTVEVAQRAVRYPAGAVYLFDEGAFPEPDAFWIRGGRTALAALDRTGRPVAAGGRTAVLFLRNAPVANHLAVEIGGWRQTLALAPGEERTLDVPLDVERAATLVRLSATTGFRPSEVSAGNADHRFLGVWVQLRD